MIFGADTLETLKSGYPDRPARLRHGLSSHPLLTLDRLAALARALPPAAIEYNSGDGPIDQRPGGAPANGFHIDDALLRIGERQSWFALKNIEQDAAYRRLLDDCLDEIADVAAARTGRMHKREAFIFVSSPGAVTPFHMDPEHNILLQISGRKTIRVFPARDRALVPDERHEAFHAPGGRRNLPYRPEFEPRARALELGPGEAAYVPVKAPHWVKVGDCASVSFSITWRSRASDAEARLHRANAWLRARGALPAPAGAAPMRDRAKILAERIASRLARRA